MNETLIQPITTPRRLKITKFFFNILLIFLVCETLAVIGNTMGFIATPESSIQIIDKEHRYFRLEGKLGHTSPSYDHVAMVNADLPVENPKLFAVSFNLLLLITEVLPKLFVMLLARRLLKEITASYTPFTDKTPKLIRSAGMILLLKGALGKLILQVGLNFINFRRLSFVNPYEINWILIGLFILLLADVFAKGCALQQEFDETL